MGIGRSIAGQISRLRRAVSRLGESAPEARRVTGGPGFHWYGYYDKLAFDPSGRFMLGMEVGFENRSPRPEDEIRVGIIDLMHGRWIDLDASRAWCWQQGCMLQWIPGSESRIIWNDRQDGAFVSHVLEVRTRHRRTLPHPVTCLTPDGRQAFFADFARLAEMRPGYGYAGGRDAHAHENAPAASGIWSMDLGSGEARLVFSLEDASTLGAARARHHKSWFNHLLVSPDGGRLAFLHRWREGRRRVTRMLTIGTDGSQPRVVDPHGSTSHFIWRDPRHIVAWTVQPSSGKGFHVIEDGGGRAEIVHRGLMDRDGHVSFLPGGRFILCDTYADAAGYQDLYLVDTETSRRQGLGSFRQPGGYGGEWRCDLHPRSSPDGRTVAIDSAHSGHGRQIHLLDVSAITGAG